MSVLTVPVSPQGLIVTVGVAVSGPKADAIKAAGKPIPQTQVVRALIDTGASCSAIDPGVIQALELTPTGTASIHTPSTGVGSHECNLYDVALFILMGSAQVHIASLTAPVIEAKLAGQGFDVLIGRDVLSQGLLVYDGKAGNLSLAF
ncbi:MAG: aspartyl protease family protein [Planctomycetia bacterium]|nr:aspartyl protease family protein [Planctomycetia bacterium]